MFLFGNKKTQKNTQKKSPKKPRSNTFILEEIISPSAYCPVPIDDSIVNYSIFELFTEEELITAILGTKEPPDITDLNTESLVQHYWPKTKLLKRKKTMNQQIIRSTIATLALVAGIGIATPARAFLYQDPLLGNSDNLLLTESERNLLLQRISDSSDLAIEELEIVDYQQGNWGNGCLGLVFPGPRRCTTAVVRGWIVSVESETQQWTYHNGRLASHYQWEFDAEQKKWSNHVTNYTGSTPLNFFGIPETQAYNPANIEGFRYTITSDSWSGSVTLPTSTTDTEENLFILMTENSTTQVTSRTDLNLNTANGEGVKEFTITDINPSINWLEYRALISPDFYSSPTFTYQVELLEKAEESSTKSIPEPSAIFGLLTLGICRLVKGKK